MLGHRRVVELGMIGEHEHTVGAFELILGDVHRLDRRPVDPERRDVRIGIGHLGALATQRRCFFFAGGFLDSAGAKFDGKQMIACEMTLRKGRIVWDLNARAADDWKTFDYRRRRGGKE